MPIFVDLPNWPGIPADACAAIRARGLEQQDESNVTYRYYWIDKTTGVGCLLWLPTRMPPRRSIAPSTPWLPARSMWCAKALSY